MDNLDFGNIAISAAIIGFLNLVIVILIKTETILKYIESIKSVIRLDYKSRAKRSEDEVRIFRKHELVARERVRHSYISDIMWNCRWTWNWSENLEPINIQGYCLGDKKINWEEWVYFSCNHPVNAFFLYPPPQEGQEPPPPSNFSKIGLLCSQEGNYPHRQTRAEFEVIKSESENLNSAQAFERIISKNIISKRNLKITREIQKIRLQFWR